MRRNGSLYRFKAILFRAQLSGAFSWRPPERPGMVFLQDERVNPAYTDLSPYSAMQRLLIAKAADCERRMNLSTDP